MEKTGYLPRLRGEHPKHGAQAVRSRLLQRVRVASHYEPVKEVSELCPGIWKWRSFAYYFNLTDDIARVDDFGLANPYFPLGSVGSVSRDLRTPPSLGWLGERRKGLEETCYLDVIGHWMEVFSSWRAFWHVGLEVLDGVCSGNPPSFLELRSKKR